MCALAGFICPQFSHFAAPGLLPACASAIITVISLVLWDGFRQEIAGWRRQLVQLTICSALGFSVGAGLAASGERASQSFSTFPLAWLVALTLLFLAHLVRHRSQEERSEEKTLPLVIVGQPNSARGVYQALTRPHNSRRGLRVAAIFADSASEWPEAKRQNIVVGETQWTRSFAECCGIQHAIVAVPNECDRSTEALFRECAQIFKYLFVAPQISLNRIALAAHTAAGGELTLQVGDGTIVSQTGSFKRLVDMAGAVFLGILSLPFLVVIALGIRLTSKGPILFKQMRIGKGNRVFTALKFRTMYVDANERLSEYLAKDHGLRKEWQSVQKLKNDPRVTSIGKFLRRFSFDELPQFWNVLVGDMSLVGPRPIVIFEIERYGAHYAAYESVRPGLTGLWQVSGRNNTTYKERIDFDSYYVRNWSHRLDARILARTFRAVISGAGAY
jgi:Undecaprenyl-phosphate galactose phosphotransferase WbaP